MPGADDAVERVRAAARRALEGNLAAGGEKLAAHIVLTRGERSELAELAANLL